METFVPVQLPPGVRRSGTPYQSKNRWYDSHLVRWHEGAIRPVGGWSAALLTSGLAVQVTGKPRASLAWRKNDATVWLATGTQANLYAFSSGVLTDITPAGLVGGSADGLIATGTGLYGDGVYGAGIYGGASLGGTVIDADTWSLDNFGEILVACLTSDGKLYGSTPITQAAQLAGSPTGCRALVVTPERFLFALGAGGDPRLVQWPSQQSTVTWTPSASNTAGSFPLQTNGRLVTGRRTARETLLWTDADLWGAVYIGGQLIYSFQQRGRSCGILGPNAVALAESAAFWMGDGQFWTYDGAVRPVDCEVADYVFGDFNKAQKAKVAAVAVPQFGEVWWYYPSSLASENDRYVLFNYRLGYWALGKIGRAAGSSADVFAQPMLWTSDGVLYAHELGQNRAGQIAYLESGPLELGNGDRVARVQTMLPDDMNLGDLTAIFFASFAPNDVETTFGPYQLAEPTLVRLTGRQVRLRLAENNILSGATADTTVVSADSMLTADTASGTGVNWRAGTFRLGVLEGSRR